MPWPMLHTQTHSAAQKTAPRLREMMKPAAVDHFTSLILYLPEVMHDEFLQICKLF